MAKSRNRAKQDLGDIQVVKGINGEVIANETLFRKRWEEYFTQLLNEENKRGVLQASDRIEGPELDISEQEVKEALRRMKKGKASGPSGVVSEMFTALGGYGVSWLTEMFRKVWREERMPEEWRKSYLIPIYKQKGDILECGNYRGIKLMEHALKLLERVIDRRVRELVEIKDIQFGFRKGRSTVDAMHIIKQLQERYLEKSRELYHVFVDLEKAYDRVPRDVIYWALRKKGATEKIVRVIEATYENAQTAVKTKTGLTGFFDIRVGLHQGSALSPFLFVTVVEALTEEICVGPPWELLYADDLVITAETKEELQDRVSKWQERLEAGGLKINVNKTEVMRSTRNKELDDGSNPVKDRAGKVFNCVAKFKYLGSTISEQGGSSEDVQERIKTGWMKWREASGVLCDRKMPKKLKAKVYKAVVRPAMLYGAQTWCMKKADNDRLERAEMRMLRHTNSISLLDHCRNEDIRNDMGIRNISEKVRESRLRWAGHVWRREKTEAIRMVTEMNVAGRRPRGRPRKTWRDTVAEDLRATGLSRRQAKDREVWRRRTRMADPRATWDTCQKEK